MRTIRQSTFETNSSSMHTITICSENEFTDFTEGRWWFNRDEEKLYSSIEIYDFLKEELDDSDDDEPLPEYPRFCEILVNLNRRSDDYDDSELEEDERRMKELLKECSFYPYMDYGLDFETYEEYATVDGVKVVAFGYYGYC